MWSGANGRNEGLLVPKLYENGIISLNMFSFYLSNVGNDSFIDFGAPNPSVMSTREIVWLDVINEDGTENWWTNKITGI